jgi:hypothetical protein
MSRDLWRALYAFLHKRPSGAKKPLPSRDRVLNGRGRSWPDVRGPAVVRARRDTSSKDRQTVVYPHSRAAKLSEWRGDGWAGKGRSTDVRATVAGSRRSARATREPTRLYPLPAADRKEGRRPGRPSRAARNRQARSENAGYDQLPRVVGARRAQHQAADS